MIDAAVRFAKLFRGRTDIQGTENGGCLRKRVNFGHYRGHLQGRFGLGIYPLLDDGTCAWATVDVDRNDLDAVLLLQRLLADASFSPLLFTSRAKGYHVTIFVDGWARAGHLRSILLVHLLEAGLPESTEIYPRRDAGAEELAAPGGYLRLPYLAVHAAGPTKATPAPGRRVAIDPKTLRPLALEEFLDRAEEGRVSPDLIRARAEVNDEGGGNRCDDRERPGRPLLPEVPEDPADLGVKPRVADLIRSGWSQDSGYRSRSEAQQAAVDAMVNSGHDDIIIRAVLMHPAYGISQRSLERPPSKAEWEIARCIAKARATSRPKRGVTDGLVPKSAHRLMVDLNLRPLAWPVLAEIEMTVDYSTGVSIVTLNSLAKRLGRSRASIHRDAIKPVRDAGILEAVPLERQGGRWRRVGHRVRAQMAPSSTSGSIELDPTRLRECESKRSVYQLRHGDAQVSVTTDSGTGPFLTSETWPGLLDETRQQGEASGARSRRSPEIPRPARLEAGS